jgi:raffinose/stachyose/melibiose transport system permease protein/N-acetylglucosamine transport system permease protein
LISKGKIISKKEKTVFIIVSMLFAVYAISLLYPFFWAFFASLKDKNEFFGSYVGMPESWLFSNYADAFTKMEVAGVNLLGMFANSVIYTALSTLISVFSCALTAYCVSKYDFKLRNVLYGTAIFIMLVPVVGSMPAMYKLVSTLGIKDNVVLICILNGSGFGMNFLLLYGFFKSISWEYAEAAQIDGCGDFRIFFRIMLPQAKPALIAVAIITAISVWNDYMTPFLYLENSATLAYGLYYFEKDIQFTYDYPVLFAGILLSILPLLVVFIAFQETIIENTVAGGLKG